MHFIRIFIVLFAISSTAEEPELPPALLKSIKHPRLCNSHENDPYCVRHEGKATITSSCDERKYRTDSCISAELSLSQFKEHDLLSLVPSVDQDRSIRRIVINIDTVKSFSDVGTEIDKFLTTRPWWNIVKEPYEWYANTTENNQIIFERTIEKIEDFLRLISSVQYPDIETCGKTKLQLFTDVMIHPGWGSVMRKVAHSGIGKQFVTHVIYSSEHNRPSDKTAFSSSDECQEYLNKYECAFLPMTNCSIPRIISKCDHVHCISSFNDHCFSNVTLEGEALTKHDCYSSASKPKNELQASLLQYRKVFFPMVIPWFMRDTDRKPEAPNHMISTVSIYMDFVLRMNAFMRSRVAKLLFEYRELHNFKENERCVGAHVRRGDRVMYGVNMTEWCVDPKNRGKTHDKGCETRTFASITMNELFDDAEKLVDPSVRTLYVASDDENWIIEQKNLTQSTRPEWKVVFVPAPKPPPDYKEKTRGGQYKGYQYMRKLGGTHSGAYFLASMKAMQQCEAMLGHFASDSSGLLYNQMCVKHGQYEGVCPYRYNVAKDHPN